MHQLIHLPTSPWSEKARWALDAQGIGYRAQAFTPMIGEPALRLRLRAAGPVSVPVLMVDGSPLSDSWEIARWAARTTDRRPLIDPTSRPFAEAWNATSERALDAGRARTLRRTLNDPAALRASVPAPFDHLGPATALLGRAGAMWLRRRYCDAHNGDDSCAAQQHRALTGLRAALADAGGDYLAGEFSYADICAAVILAFVAPPQSLLEQLSPAAAHCWRDDALAAEFDDVVAWRDRIYARHRRTVTPARA